MSATRDAQVFTLKPLSPVLGGEVTGLDLRRPFDAATQQAVYDAFVRYHVLCFRGQHLDQNEQVAFSEQFGTLERHMARNRGKLNPLVHMVTNLGEDGKPSGKVASTGWHSDKWFRPEPSLATMPPDGGDTCFANMIAAFAALPDRERAELDGMGVVHDFAAFAARDGKAATPEERADAPPARHPLVRVLPETGEKSLFMGQHASHLDELPMDQGRARLDTLTAHAVAERFVYRHAWRRGDVLMWDNRCLLHRADPNFDAALHPRVLHRTCLRGTAPA